MTKLVTKEGLQKLKDELEDRKTRIRQSIARDIKEAKEQGDLSENAEYSEAKRQQSDNETRIAELESIIKNSQIFEKNGDSNGHIEIGSSVKVKFNGSEITFKLVGASESDPANFKISNESPMGKAFIGKKKGDTADVETPGGVVKYKILKVE